MILRLIISSIILSFCYILPLQAQWKPVQSPNSGNFPTISAMDFNSRDYGIACSEGRIIRTQDAGITWDTVYTNPDYIIEDIVFAGNDKAYAVGHKNSVSGCLFQAEQGILLSSVNRGLDWTEAYYEFDLYTLASTSDAIAFSFGSCGRVLKTTNAGNNWTELSVISTSDFIIGASFLDEDTGFICDANNLIFKTTDGINFTPLANDAQAGPQKDIIFLTEQLGFINGDDLLKTTTNGGDTWMTLVPQIDAIEILGDSTLFVGSALGLLRSDDLGENFAPQSASNPLPGIITTNLIYFFDHKTGFVSGPETFFQYVPPKHTLSGQVFIDEGDCLASGNEPGLEDWIITAEDPQGLKFYTTSDSEGNYNLSLDINTYTIRVTPANAYWTPCQTELTLDLGAPDSNSTAFFPIERNLLCEALQVDISTPVLTHCASNKYTVSYSNQGTKTANNAVIEITLDPALDFISSSIPAELLSDNRLRFELGIVQESAADSFSIQTFLACDRAIVGQTHTVKASITPDSICIPPDPNWDYSSIKLESSCVEDSLNLKILNTGTQEMLDPASFIIIEDNVLLLKGFFRLDTEEDSALVIYPNGGTIRLEVDQAPGHPGLSKPSLTIEGCGTNQDDDFSRGYVLQYPEDDANPFISIDAQESIAQDSIGLSIFRSFPKGYGSEHFIKANQDIEYHVVFQNNSDTSIQEVLVQCDASAFLELSTVVPGVSSHPFDFNVLQNGIIEFDFQEVNLLEDQQGFIKFRIQQKENNLPGTEITSFLSIHYDSLTSSQQALTLVIEEDFIPEVGNRVVSGSTYTPAGNPLAAVALYDFDNLLITSDQEGNYLYELHPNIQTSLEFTARKEQTTIGVTSVDLYLLNQMIQNNAPNHSILNQRIMDADLSGTIDSDDLRRIQKHILEFNNESATLPWQFFNERQLLQDSLGFSDRYELPVPSLFNKVNFIGLKTGDLNDSYTKDTQANSAIASLSVSTQFTRDSIFYTFALPTEDLAALRSFQLALGLDLEAIQIEELQTPLSGKLAYQTDELNNTLAIIWYSAGNTIAPTDSMLFTIRASINSRDNIPSSLQLIETGLSPELYLQNDPATSLQKLNIKLAYNLPNTNELNLRVDPNPATEHMTIRYDIFKTQEIELTLFNASGQLIRAIDNQYKAIGKHETTLNLQTIPPGVYFLRLRGADIEQVRKLIIF